MKNIYGTILLVAVCAFLVFAQQPEKPFAFVALGDAGCGCDAQFDIAKRMVEWHDKKPFNTILMLGDNIYGEGSIFEFWRRNKRGGHPDLFERRFDIPYKALLDRGVKFYAALGNHDMEADGGKAMIADKARFNIMSDRGYYSFTPEGAPEELIEFFALHTVTIHRRNGDSKQLEWLRGELADSKATWKILFYHHPMYSAEGSHNVDRDFKLAFEKTFIDNGVKLVLAGHNHFYSRMKPIGGITHITSGGGGRYLLGPKKNIQTERVSEKFHFMYFEVYKDHVEFWAVPAQGGTIDNGIIKREDLATPDIPAE